MEQPATNPTTITFQKHKIRTVQRYGFTWFVNSDVCQVLDIADSREELDCLYPEKKMLFRGRRSTTPANSFYPSFLNLV
jgi:prophage antirepressor-like protein